MAFRLPGDWGTFKTLNLAQVSSRQWVMNKENTTIEENVEVSDCFIRELANSKTHTPS